MFFHVDAAHALKPPSFAEATNAMIGGRKMGAVCSQVWFRVDPGPKMEASSIRFQLVVFVFCSLIPFIYHSIFRTSFRMLDWTTIILSVRLSAGREADGCPAGQKLQRAWRQVSVEWAFVFSGGVNSRWMILSEWVWHTCFWLSNQFQSVVSGSEGLRFRKEGNLRSLNMIVCSWNASAPYS